MRLNKEATGRRIINSLGQDRNELGMAPAGNWNSRPRSEAWIRARISFVLLGLLVCAFPEWACSQAPVFTSAQVSLGSGLNDPEQVAVDGAGNVFIADANNNRVLKLPAGGGAQTTVPTTGLTNPQGVGVDAAGDVFISDSGNNRVVEVPAGSGAQTTLPTTGLSYPIGIAVDGAGDVFIADNGNSRVVEMPAGGGAQVTVASTENVRGIAVDGAGDLFAAEQMDGAWEFPHGGGAATPLGTGISIAAWVAVDGAGNVFITDALNNVVVEVPAGGGSQVTVPASGLSVPVGVAVSATGIIYIGDNGNDRVVEVQTGSADFGSMNICPSGQTSPAPCSQTVALNYAIPSGGDIATGGVLTLGAPNLDFTLASGSTCTGHFNAGGTCTVNLTFAPKRAGLRQGAVHITDDLGNVLATTSIYGTGIGPQIAFASSKQATIGSGYSYPVGVAMDGAGDVFVADSNTNEVYKVPAGGGAKTTVGTGLNSPAGVAVDGAGDVFIADQGNFRVVEVPAGGGAQTTIGNNLLSPVAVAVDGAGDVFIVDLGNYTVQKVPSGGGLQTTVGTGLLAPQGVAVDGAGDVFIADSGNNRVVEVPFNGGAQTTVASGLAGPTGVSVDAAGNVFIADYGNDRVLEVDVAAGTHTTVGTGLSNPQGVAVDSAGNVFIADTGNTRVLELPRSQPPALSFVSTNIGKTSTDSPQTVVAQNIGNQPLKLSGLSYPADFPEDTAAGGSEKLCTASISLSTGQLCYLPVNFTPLHAEALSESLTLTDNALNLAGAKQSIALSGTGLAANSPAAMTSPTAGSTLTGISVTFTWTNTGATKYYLSVGSTGAGSTNVYNSGWRTVTSWAADPLPTNGEKLYVRLSTDYSGTVVYEDYTYTASTQAAITTPAAGSTLTGPNVTFNWSAATGATQYYLSVGSTGVGSTNIYNSGWRTVTSWTATGLPTNGETLYVMLSTDYNGLVAKSNTTYKAATAAVLTTPTPGTTLSGSSVTFDWTAGTTGATQYYLSIGSTGVGSSNIYNSGWRTVTAWAADPLPTNGEKLYVRLSTDYSGTVVHNDYTYTASTQAAVTSPTAGSTLGGPSVTFNWSAATGATQYYLSVGSTGVGSTNIYNSGWRTVTSWTATGLPTNGETLYVMLSTDYNGLVAKSNTTYKAATAAVLTTPTPGTTLSGASVTFDWAAGTTGATEYALSVGSTGVGSSNIYNSGWRDVTSWDATGLPTNGETLYVRLSTNFGGTAVHNDYTYTAH